jgi:ATP-dependent helicase/nuclease subunit B
MIEILRVESNLTRRHLVDRLERELREGSTTWVVSDLRSKLSVQRRLLTESGNPSSYAFVSGRSVLRASEVWREAARKIEPELQIVSRELMLTAISGWLDGRQESWLKSPGAAKTTFAYVRQLLPILAAESTRQANNIQEDQKSLLEDWLNSESGSRDRWRDWYRIAREIWEMLRTKKLCAGAWLPGWLIAHRDSLEEALGRDFVFDLGAELTHVESELLLALAGKRRIRILRPSPNWEIDYPDCRLAADWVIKQSDLRGIKCVVRESDGLGEGASLETRTYRRLPSAAAEVKEAIASVRAWLEYGISPSSIAIVAPDLEAYWPVLSLHLEAEGISSGKPVVSALHSFPDMMKWLARLRIRTGIPDPRDLEADVFGEEQPPLSYSAFREVFTRVYETSDLDLSQDLQRYFKNEFKDRGQWLNEALARDQFIAMATSLLRVGDDLGRATRALKVVLEECPPDMEFKQSQWVKYLSESMAKVEVTVIPASVEGIWCLNLSSLDGVDCTHVVAMGLHEGALRSQLGTALQASDIRAIERDLGFVIDGEDRKRAEFEARWILLQNGQSRLETLLLFADTDMAGTVQTPSWTWLAGAWLTKGKSPEIEVPKETRFDRLMNRPFDEIGSAAQRKRLQFEQGQAEPVQFGGDLVKKLSASTIDAVSRCPLQFALTRILAMRDLGEIDLDADKNRQGTLQHKILEILGQRQWPELNENELNDVVEKCKVLLEREEGKPLVRTPQAWSSLRRRMVRVARSVLEYERAQRHRHPGMKTIGCEVSFSGQFFEDETSVIRGTIDRIDQDDQGRTLIIDYKNRARHQNYNSWAKNQYWQPFIYAYAIEKGWTAERVNGRLAGVFIFDVTKKTRGKGMRLAEGNFDLFEIEDEKSAKQLQSRDDLEASYQLLEERVLEVKRILREGDFRPDPYQKEACDSCRWIYACRAPHLELSL